MAIITVLNYIEELERTIKELQEIKKEAILDDLGKQYNVYKEEMLKGMNIIKEKDEGR